ncbi:DUF2231 domain-containing protein [Microbacterium sp.]|uniref:DUF2231 domain-containing protein n=1 Tax=Microbacterium sp. TaxID=51671 RepID=UPI003A94A1F7
MDIFAEAGGLRIAGLPLHPLLVHAVVVLTPLTALAVVLAAAWPAARRRLGWAPQVAALIVAALVPVTVLAGQDLAAQLGYTPAILRHEALGLMLIPWTIALLVASVAVAAGERMLPRLRRSRPRAARAAAVITAAALITSVGTIVITVLAGDAGARAVWGAV